MEMRGDPERLALQGRVVLQRGVVPGGGAQQRPAAAGVGPDEDPGRPERTVPGHGGAGRADLLGVARPACPGRAGQRLGRAGEVAPPPGVDVDAPATDGLGRLPACANASVGRKPPCWIDTPRGSQPNDRLVTSGLNWSGAAGPVTAGPGRARPGRDHHDEGRDQRRDQQPRRRPGWPGASAAWPGPGGGQAWRSTWAGAGGSRPAVSANRSRICCSIMAGAPPVDLVLRGPRAGAPAGPASRRPQGPAHRVQRPGRLALDRAR